MTAHNVITRRNQTYTSKIHFRMASKTSARTCTILEPQLHVAIVEFLCKQWMPLHLVYTIAILVSEEN